MEEKKRKIRNLQTLVVVGLIIGATIVIFGILGIEICPFKRIFGVACPGCGTTRALVHLFQGDIAGSFLFHPLWPITILLVILFVLSLFMDKPAKLINNRYFASIFLAVYLITFIVRYIVVYPSPPFDYQWNSLLGIIIKFFQGL